MPLHQAGNQINKIKKKYITMNHNIDLDTEMKMIKMNDKLALDLKVSILLLIKQ